MWQSHKLNLKKSRTVHVCRWCHWRVSCIFAILCYVLEIHDICAYIERQRYVCIYVCMYVCVCACIHMKFYINPGHTISMLSFGNCLLCVFLRKSSVCVENTASRKVSGRSRKGFRKENRKVFHRVRNTASRKVSGRSRKGFRKLGWKVFVQFSILCRSSLSRKVLFNFPYVLA
jgi:hypothetical protein